MDISFPLDADGFFRRECPNCEQEFKWHHGPTNDAPADFVYSDLYWCPRCGESAGPDSWWTQDQLDYQRQMMDGLVHDELRDAFKTALKPQRNSIISIKMDAGARPAVPDPLVEIDDMITVAAPCHPWEPVKVPVDAQAPFFCLLCGSAFAV